MGGGKSFHSIIYITLAAIPINSVSHTHTHTHMGDTDGGLHPVVDRQSLDEDEDKVHDCKPPTLSCCNWSMAALTPSPASIWNKTSTYIHLIFWQISLTGMCGGFFLTQNKHVHTLDLLTNQLGRNGWCVFFGFLYLCICIWKHTIPRFLSYISKECLFLLFPSTQTHTHTHTHTRTYTHKQAHTRTQTN